MSGWFVWIAAGVVTIVVAAAGIEAYVKRNRKRSLVSMRPDPERLKRRPWEADGVAKVQVPDQPTQDQNENATPQAHQSRKTRAENKETQHD